MKKETSNPTSTSISNIQLSYKWEPIIENPVTATNTSKVVTPRMPLKLIIIGCLKLSRTIVSPPSLQNLGNQKLKLGHEFDAVCDANFDHQLNQEQTVCPSNFSNLYNILPHQEGEILVEEETDIDTNIDTNSH